LSVKKSLLHNKDRQMKQNLCRSELLPLVYHSVHNNIKTSRHFSFSRSAFQSIVAKKELRCYLFMFLLSFFFNPLSLPFCVTIAFAQPMKAAFSSVDTHIHARAQTHKLFVVVVAFFILRFRLAEVSVYIHFSLSLFQLLKVNKRNTEA
jgi:hypothetical protein